MMGAKVSYDSSKVTIKREFAGNGNAHLWFPTYELLLDLIIHSKIRLCRDISFYQYFIDDHNFICNQIPENEMFVMRSVPNDNRAHGAPISIVCDFLK
jgi:hypothetical protein